METEDWKALQENCKKYFIGKKCGSGSLLEFVNNIKVVYDKFTKEERESWRGSSRWGNETFDDCEKILKENKLI